VKGVRGGDFFLSIISLVSMKRGERRGERGERRGEDEGVGGKRERRSVRESGVL
jgi:hypothetical protein